MAVSQRQFAAEVVTLGGTVDYFDDIGCLARWWNERRPPAGSGVFVVDDESGRWLEAGGAHYVQSDRLNTPMRFGLVAFAGAAQAEAAAAEFEGRLLGWDEVLREAAP